MFCWVILVVILVGVGIWIVSAVLRNTEEERQRNLRRPPGGEQGRAPGRPQTDLDRFLEEARRRQREASEKRQTSANPWARAPESAPAQRPKRVEQPRLPAARPVSQGDRVRASERGLEPPRTARPVPTMGKRGDLQQQPPPSVRPAMPAPSRLPASAARPPAGVAPVVLELVPEEDENSQVTLPAVLQPLKANASAQPPRPASPALAQVLAMLRTPKSAAMAYMLREILDAPKCRRTLPSVEPMSQEGA
jgi:hypothetical protein